MCVCHLGNVPWRGLAAAVGRSGLVTPRIVFRGILSEKITGRCSLSSNRSCQRRPRIRETLGLEMDCPHIGDNVVLRKDAVRNLKQTLVGGQSATSEPPSTATTVVTSSSSPAAFSKLWKCAGNLQIGEAICCLRGLHTRKLENRPIPGRAMPRGLALGLPKHHSQNEDRKNPVRNRKEASVHPSTSPF